MSKAKGRRRKAEGRRACFSLLASLLCLFLLLAPTLRADTATDNLLARAWPYAPFASMRDLGSGVAIVFSPDLSVKGNCDFYAALGFTCFDSPDWNRVLGGIVAHNASTPERPIRTVILETHGTNGNGLKLQASYDPAAPRSYISVAGLQELLEPAGVRHVIISACNSGRLMRSAIYRNLDPHNGDKLFLPPTLGIIGASRDFDPQRSGVEVIAPASSHIEMTMVGSVSELAPRTRAALKRSAWLAGVKLPAEFAISDVLMQILTHDPSLELKIADTVDELSRRKTSEQASERLYAAFLRRLNSLARREAAIADAATANSR